VILGGAVSGAGLGPLLAWGFLASTGTIVMAAPVGALLGVAFAAAYWAVAQGMYESVKEAADPTTGPADVGQAVKQAIGGSDEYIWIRIAVGALGGAATGAIAGVVIGSLLGAGWNWLPALGGVVGAILGMVGGWAFAVARIAQQVVLRRGRIEVLHALRRHRRGGFVAAGMGAVLGGLFGAAGGGLGWGTFWPESQVVVAAGLGIVLAAAGAALGWRLASRDQPPGKGPRMSEGTGSRT
jgi:hypothetical protein